MFKEVGPQSTFNNTRKLLIDVPGFGQCPVNFELASCVEERFAHSVNDSKQNSRLTVQELSVFALLSPLIEKLDWNKKVFSKEIVENGIERL
jgi:hypothetical protein